MLGVLVLLLNWSKQEGSMLSRGLKVVCNVRGQQECGCEVIVDVVLFVRVEAGDAWMVVL